MVGPRPRHRRCPGGAWVRLWAAWPPMHHQCHRGRACRRSPGNGESGADVQRHTLLDESRGSGCLVRHRPCRVESEQVGTEHAV